MPEELDYDDNDTDDIDDSSLPAKLRKQLRDANKRTTELEAKLLANEGAARRVAFLDAAIPETKQTAYFRETYSGELTPEAIRSAAIVHGFLDETSPDAAASMEAMMGQSEAMSGAQSLIAPGAQEEYEREIDEAVSRAPFGQEAKAIDEVYRRYAGVIDTS